MKLRSLLVLVLFATLAAPAPVRSVSLRQLDEGVATRVKNRRGVITRVALAANPENGTFLAVYEALDRIYATVLKPTKKDGVYRGKKARRISRVRRPNHRPSALWDAENGEWIVAWDTAPDDLVALAAGLGDGTVAAGESEIRVRRVRALNGRPRGDAEIISETGRMLIGPKLRTVGVPARGRRAASVDLFNSAVEPVSGGESLLRVQRWTLGDDGAKVLGTFVGFGLGTIGTPLPQFPGSNDEFVFPFEVLDSAGVGTAHVLRYVIGTVEYGDTTPAQAPETDTRAPGVALIGSSVGPDGLRSVWSDTEDNCYLQYLDADLTATGPVTRIADRCLLGVPMLGAETAEYPGWTLGWSAGFARVGARRADATGARLTVVDDEGNSTDGPTLMTAAKGVLADTMLIDPVSGRAWILWSEVRNNRRSRLWLEVVDP